jgi:hypothetical protein
MGRALNPPYVVVEVGQVRTFRVRVGSGDRLLVGWGGAETREGRACADDRHSDGLDEAK